MNYVNFSLHFPDAAVLREIKRAAKARGISPGMFIRLSAERCLAQNAVFRAESDEKEKEKKKEEEKEKEKRKRPAKRAA
jgi:hypothetical protein